MAILPKAIYRFNVIPLNLHMTFFTELEQIIQKLIWNRKRLRMAKATLGQKQTRRHNSPRLQTILQRYSNKTMWFWFKNRQMDQWDRIESPKINLDA